MVESLDEVVVAGGGVKSADSTAPAVEASFELFATEEFGAITSCVVLTVTVVPLLTAVVVFVAYVTFDDEFEDNVSEIVAASSVTTSVVVFTEVVVFVAVVTLATLEVDELEDPDDASEALAADVDEALADPDDVSGASVSLTAVEF